MATYLKQASRKAETGQEDVHEAVAAMLGEIRKGGEAAVTRFSRDLDKWQGDIIVSPEAIRADPRMERFLTWIAKRPPGFLSRVPGGRR